MLVMKQITGVFIIAIFSFVCVQCNDAKKSEDSGKRKKDEKLEKTVKDSAYLSDTLKKDEVCRLSLEELQEIKVFQDTTPKIIEPSYDLAIEDLMALEIVKELKLGESLRVKYDIPLEQLTNVEIPIHQRKKNGKLMPSYAISLDGLLAFEIVEESKIVEKVQVSYNISLDGLMKLKLTDSLAHK